MAPETIKEIIHDLGLKRRAEDILSVARKCIRLNPGYAEESIIPTGDHKLGGRPDLAPPEPWPCWKATPLAFVAQFDLSKVARYKCAQCLPNQGLLSFFYDSTQRAWGFDPKHAGGCRVLHAPSGPLERRDFPLALPEEGRFQPCRVELSEDWTLPPVGSVGMESLLLIDTEKQLYKELLENVMERATSSYLFGYPEQIQTDMQLECSLVSGGLYLGDATGCQDPKSSILELEAPSWQLLLQIASEQEARMMWGDEGCIYFWIKESDLTSRAFDKAWAVLQCW